MDGDDEEKEDEEQVYLLVQFFSLKLQLDGSVVLNFFGCYLQTQNRAVMSHTDTLIKA